MSGELCRAAALHHVDCPWRPDDLEQHEGRISVKATEHGGGDHWVRHRLTNTPVRVRVNNPIGMRCMWSNNALRRPRIKVFADAGRQSAVEDAERCCDGDQLDHYGQAHDRIPTAMATPYATNLSAHSWGAEGQGVTVTVAEVLLVSLYSSMAYQQQFNVYLPRDLVRRLKHAAVDEEVSLSRLVERILTEYLNGQRS